MASVFSFGDRFSYPSSDGITSSINYAATQTLNDEDLEALSPELKTMVSMVRTNSVLLKRTKVLEIFNIITTQADPRIGLVLAAARRRSNNFPLFKGLVEVKQVMFNDADRGASVDPTVNSTLFSDGIRRVSCALTAAIILGQLPDVQREFALEIERRALEDLDRVIATYEIQSDLNKGEKAAETPPIAFYFEPLDFDIPDSQELAVEWYSPTFLTSWSPVQTYTGATSTWNIVGDLADVINAYTSQDIDRQLLASADLSGPVINSIAFHTLSFYPRKPVNGVIGYSINLKIELRPLNSLQESSIVIGATQTDEQLSVYGKSPFRWGPDALSIRDYPINGKIIVLYFTKSAALEPEELNNSYIPTVLYFRNKFRYHPEVDGDGNLTGESTPLPPSTSKLKFRVQPWHPNFAAQSNDPVDIEVSFPRLLSDGTISQTDLDNSRFSQIALMLLLEMSSIDLVTKATGCIVRNDPLTYQQSLSGLELVAWGISKAIAYIVLDVLEIPLDLEMATGDLTGPKTSFSSNPRSLRVKVQYQNQVNNAYLESTARPDGIGVIGRKNSQIWRAILDESAAVEDPRYY